MTDRLTPAADDLVERLRLAEGSGFGRVVAVMQHEAADRIEKAEARVAECRAKVIEECASLFEVDGDCTPYSRDGVAHMIRALAKEAPRHG